MFNSDNITSGSITLTIDDQNLLLLSCLLIIWSRGVIFVQREARIRVVNRRIGGDASSVRSSFHEFMNSAICRYSTSRCFIIEHNGWSNNLHLRYRKQHSNIISTVTVQKGAWLCHNWTGLSSTQVVGAKLAQAAVKDYPQDISWGGQSWHSPCNVKRCHIRPGTYRWLQPFQPKSHISRPEEPPPVVGAKLAPAAAAKHQISPRTT